MHGTGETLNIPECKWCIRIHCDSRGAAEAVLRALGVPDGADLSGWQLTRFGVHFCEMFAGRHPGNADGPVIGFLLLPNGRDA